jgi:hypothetical protein
VKVSAGRRFSKVPYVVTSYCIYIYIYIYTGALTFGFFFLVCDDVGSMVLRTYARCVSVRGCVGVRVTGCVGAWVRGCVGVRVRGCGGVWVCECVWVWVCGFGCVWV